MAYFTDPMGDEFKKAIEEAMKELEEEDKVEKAPRKKSVKKKSMNQLSRKTKKSLK